MLSWHLAQQHLGNIFMDLIVLPPAQLPEVPGVSQELSPGLSVLCWSHVTRGDLLPCWDVEPRLDLDQSLLRIVLTDRVTPRNIILSLSPLQFYITYDIICLTNLHQIFHL